MSFTEHRLKLILDTLKQTQRVNVKELADHLQVSQESIRRDLKELESRGYARRVYGGAVLDQQESDQPFTERLRVASREKARIGEAAAALVEDGMKVFIDTGTTTLACLKHLENRKDITVVSNSLAVAAHFFHLPQASVRVLGGRMRPEYQATYGHETVAALKEHFFDLAIIAISAIHSDRGFMDFGEDEAVLRRDVGVRFKGVDRSNIEEYCVSEGWVRMAVETAKDRFGNPLIIKANGPVEPYFRDKKEG